MSSPRSISGTSKGDSTHSERRGGREMTDLVGLMVEREVASSSDDDGEVEEEEGARAWTRRMDIEGGA